MTTLQDDDSTQNTLEVVLFQAGGCLSAIAASQVGAMSSDNNVCDAIPIAEVFGMEQVTTELAQKKLELKSVRAEAGSDSIDVLITPPVDLLNLAVTDIYPLPPLLAARQRLRWLRALAMHREQENISLLLLFDVLDTGSEEESQLSDLA